EILRCLVGSEMCIRDSFFRILEECRWELDMRGYGHVRFYVSGGIKEEDIDVLNPVVDGYGIGTSISNAPVVDYAMDIMELEGKPLAKRGKWSGSKRVLRCTACGKGSIVPLRDTPAVCGCGGIAHDILVPVLNRGNLLLDMASHKAIREYVLGQMERVDLRD
ncbi:MAG: nicotinate phosphoribosyltransferase, partial [Deltaproteobacteria bacterium]|nr:nicotinate phosphoribosyltransferase [Deltaproteobacteria bacterium]